MRLLILIYILTLPIAIMAQVEKNEERCYQIGSVDKFLLSQRAEKRRSIVLFNFDDDSG